VAELSGLRTAAAAESVAEGLGLSPSQVKLFGEVVDGEAEGVSGILKEITQIIQENIYLQHCLQNLDYSLNNH